MSSPQGNMPPPPPRVSGQIYILPYTKQLFQVDELVCIKEYGAQLRFRIRDVDMLPSPNFQPAPIWIYQINKADGAPFLIDGWFTEDKLASLFHTIPTKPRFDVGTKVYVSPWDKQEIFTVIRVYICPATGRWLYDVFDTKLETTVNCPEVTLTFAPHTHYPTTAKEIARILDE